MKISANGIDIHYTIEGKGPVVTMSHCLACDLSLWDRQAQALRDRYRVLRFDTRGHGQTSTPPGPYSLDQMAEDVCGLLTGLGIDATHFVGLSMGGMIGQLFALKYPEMVQSLVLCDTTSQWPDGSWPVWEKRIRTVQAKGMNPVVEPTIERWFTAPFRERRRDVTDRIRGLLRATSPEGYVGCCHAVAKINTTDGLGAIDCPALVMVGEEDPGTPVAMARTMCQALPSAELAILNSASHLSNVEQPEEFNQVLLRFLDKATGQG